MRKLTLVFLLLSAPVVANDENCDETPSGQSALAPVIRVAQMATANRCPNAPDASRLRHICMSISERVRDPQPLAPHYNFEYERKILEASCVNIPGDSEAVQNQKIQRMWQQLESTLICNSTSFGVNNGGLIKFAISSLFDDLIENVAIWRVNLNKVDASDNMTPLDYLKARIDNSQGTENARFRSYFTRLRNAGAKYRSEL